MHLQEVATNSIVYWNDCNRLACLNSDYIIGLIATVLLISLMYLYKYLHLMSNFTHFVIGYVNVYIYMSQD